MVAEKKNFRICIVPSMQSPYFTSELDHLWFASIHHNWHSKIYFKYTYQEQQEIENRETKDRPQVTKDVNLIFMAKLVFCPGWAYSKREFLHVHI